MTSSNRRGITLIECLVSLVASSVILGGLLGLYTVADQAARTNSGDIFTTAMDYNLDRVLSEIGASTSAGTNPTRRSINRTGSYGHGVTQPWDLTPSPNQILVYDRPRRIVATSYYTPAQGGPVVNPFPAAMISYRTHPFPLVLNPTLRNIEPEPYFGKPDGMTNIDISNSVEFTKDWETGIVALSRRDPDPISGRYRTGILWAVEMPFNRLQALLGAQSFCPNGTGSGPYPSYIADINARIDVNNPQLLFPGTRILGVGIQSFAIDAGDPMTWRVTR